MTNVLLETHLEKALENPTFFKEYKIALEKRKRSQLYTTLDYILSVISYFDFFSRDAFDSAYQSKLLTHVLEKDQVLSEFLLFTFTDSNSSLSKILSEYGITKTKINDLITTLYPPKKRSSFEIFVSRIPILSERIFSKFNRIDKNQLIPFSHEVNIIFEKSAENALSRFKTPVITPEIIFITMLEEKRTKIGKILLNYLPNELDWYLLRYKLLKRIHYQESKIRNEVKKNDHYFAYLLKTQLSEIQFDRLIESELLSLGVLYFRYLIIHGLKNVDLRTILEHDIQKSIFLTNKRQYSS